MKKRPPEVAPTTTRLVLVRHGQTAANVARLLSGSTDLPLDATGARQAQLVALRIASEIDAHALVSSPLARARATAAAIANLTGLQIQESPELREVSFGDFEGLSVAQVEADHPHVAVQMLDPHSTTLRWPNGDHMHEFYQRTQRAFAAIAQEHSGKTAIVVAHGAVIGGYLRYVTGQPINAWRTFNLRNCSLSLVDVIDGMPHLVIANDCHHLDDEVALADEPERP